MTVHIVYAHTLDGGRFALKAFDSHAGATRHIAKCTCNPLNEDGQEMQSPAEMLGIAGFSIDPLTVES